MKCLIATFGRVNILMGADAESAERFWLWGGCKSIEWQVTMLSLSQQSVHNLVSLFLQFFLSDVLHSSHLTQSFVSVGKGGFHFLCRFTSLRRMGFIHYEGILFTCILVHFLIDKREAVKCTDNDTWVVIVNQSLQFCWWIAVLNSLYSTIHMVKTENGLLKLWVQYSTVCDDKHAVKHRLQFGIL